MILVTGATGHVGDGVVRRLAAAGVPLLALVRNPARAPAGVELRIADYEDHLSLRAAFAGVARLVFIASDGDRMAVLRHHRNVLAAAAAARVGRIVFTSIIDVGADSPFYFTPVYREAESRLRDGNIPHTILRCGLFADFILRHWVDPARGSGVMRLPLGNARIAPVSRDDVAAACAASVIDDAQAGAVHRITGLAAHSAEEIARMVACASGSPMRHEPCSPAAYRDALRASLDEPWPDVFASLCASIAAGSYADPSTDFLRLVGRPAEDFPGLLARASQAA